ncbi:hypothetical protein FRB94_000716 [Tulasnella sp. JGI-2019a]|nr:hypothetical protein FRB93_003033 [Tulasnella sp. JGI-2019a]KAG9006406.1 hypothetical protein FRB94_000716 [Tulasnella sp. JGI-2019a]
MSIETDCMQSKPPSEPVLQQIMELLLLDYEALKNGTEGSSTGNAISSHERRLETIDHKIDYLLTANPAVQNVIREAVDHLRHQRTMLAPVHRLPVEVLTEVFRHVSGIKIRPAQADTIDSLHVLAQVCKSWASVIKSSPALWTVIHAAHSRDDWTSALKLSHSSPLTLNLIDNYQREDGYISLWTAVSKQIWRWQSASLVLVPYMDLSSLENDPAPILRELRLKGDGMLSSGRSLDLFQGRRAPELRHITLEGVSLRDWSAPTLSGLHSLTVTSFLTEPGPSLHQFYDILRACPDLRHLCVRGVMFQKEITVSDPDPGSLIQLPHLQDLDLHTLANILGALDSVTKCTKFNLWCPGHLFPKYLPKIKPHLSTFILPFLASQKDVVFTLGSGALTLRVGHGAAQALSDAYSLHIWGLSSTGIILREFTDILASLAPDAHFTLCIDQLKFTDMAGLLGPLHHLSRVETLEVHQCGQKLDAILIELASPHAMPDGSRRWMFPLLKHISLRQSLWWSSEALLNVVKSRAPGVENGGDGRSPLESLRICEESSVDRYEFFKAIRKILGTGATWEGHDN